VDAGDRRRRIADEARAGQHLRRVAERHHRWRTRPLGTGAIGAVNARLQRRLGLADIGERKARAGDLLVVLVTLASDEDDVGRRRRADRVADRLGAVLDHVDLVVADRADQDLRQDQIRRFEARVVAGDDDVAGEPAGDRAHQRPLGRIAIAAAAKHAPEHAAALLGQRRERGQRLVERVGRVSVVDDDLGQRVAAGAFDPHPLHPAAHRRQRRACGTGVGQRRSHGAQHADHAEEIGDVVLADHRRRDGDPVLALDDVEGQAGAAVADVRRLQSRWLGACRHGPAVDDAGAERGGELDALGIVDVDDRRLQAGPCEELRLRLPIGAHVAVVVEVVLTEVGEDRDRDLGAGEAMLGDADRRRLDRAGRELAVGEIAQRVLQRDRIGRRQAGRHQQRRLARGRARRLAPRRTRRLTNTERADHAAAPAERSERLRDPPRRRGLAVGAGDGDDRELGARVAEEAAGDVARRGLQAAQRADARVAVEVEQLDAFGLDRARARAGGKRRGDEAAAVAGVAGPATKASPLAMRRLSAPGARLAQRSQACAAARERRHSGVATSATKALLFRRHVARDDLRLDVEVGLHAHHAQRLLHDLAEYRRRDVATEVLARGRLVDHHRDDDARMRNRRHADEPGAVLLGRVARALLLVRGAALAADRVAQHLRLRRGAAGKRHEMQHVADAGRGLGRNDPHARDRRAQGRAERPRHGHRDQLAVVREHGVGVGDLEQRRRQAIAVAHRRLLDRPPALVGAQPPGDDAGKAELRLLAEADELTAPHLARREGHRHPHRADVARFWITSVTVRLPCSASR
jgi:hypothetical protein